MDKLKGKIEDRDSREWDDYDYRMEKFEYWKNWAMNLYKNGGQEIDGEDCKGNAKNSILATLPCINNNYTDDYIDYCKEAFTKGMNSNTKTASQKEDDEDSDSEVEELKEDLDYKRKKGPNAVGSWFCDLDGYQQIIIGFELNSEEREYVDKYKKLLESADTHTHKDFINILKDWYHKKEYEYNSDILYDLWLHAKVITDEEFDEIQDYEPENDSHVNSTTNNRDDSVSIADVKTKLEQLKQLKEEGLISEDDFQKKKSALIDLI